MTLSNNMKILSTVGPASLNNRIIEEMTSLGVNLFRINLSHTKLEDVTNVIDKIQSWTDVPVCLDSEGAQIRNGPMESDHVVFNVSDSIHIHREPVPGDSRNIYFTPLSVFNQLRIGDTIRVDFNAATIRVIEINETYAVAEVIQSGYVGSNKAVDIDRPINLDPVTPKDEAAFKIGKEKGLTHFALSFTNCANDVNRVREIIGENANLISKIESIRGVLNLDEILPLVDQILIDRGDLSREVPIEKIPFVQRTIIRHASTHNTPVYVATNLLESMIHSASPTRAEVNDVASTLLMGASGLVLAAETAIGAHPVGAVKMIRSVFEQCELWSPEKTLQEVIS